MDTHYRELTGTLDGGIDQKCLERATVTMSRISRGSAQGSASPGLMLRYVARGVEHYQIAGRHYRIAAGQFMLAPQSLGSEVEVRGGELGGTLGLCVYLPESEPIADATTLADQPIVLPAPCFPLGVELIDFVAQVMRGTGRRASPGQLVSNLYSTLGQLVDEVVLQTEAVGGKKRLTRYEAVRRVNVARAYLHSVTHRAVPLDELGAAAGVSPFHLLRNFRDCLGETPAMYHRKLRLTLAQALARRSYQTFEAVSDRFGFAGGSSFSHAHRRAFGICPTRANLPNADFTP